MHDDERARERVVRIAATFVAEPILETLGMWVSMLHLPVRLDPAPYNQLLQEFAGAPHAGPDSVIVALVRPEDAIRYSSASLPDSRREAAEVSARLREYAGAAVKAAATASVQVLFVICPDSPRMQTPDWQAARDGVLAELVEMSKAHPGVTVLTEVDILGAYSVAQCHDPVTDALAHVPFTEQMFAALGAVVARHLYRWYGTPAKAISVDCDNTLWIGVCGEDGASGVAVDEHAAWLQKRLLRLRDQGMLLCLCSKNNEQDVRETFVNAPGMLLRWADFAARRINWDPKSANLKSLASELSLGASAFVHLDDDPIECAEIAQFAADVLVIPLPAERARIADVLDHVWAFDVSHATAEDRQRAEFYQARGAREAIQVEARTVDEFIATLGVQVEVRPAVEDEVPRVTQLLRRTNQFNTAGGRLSHADAVSLWRQSDDHLVVYVRDRFGDYGLVGVALLRHDNLAVRVPVVAISCRALGRNVERHILRAVAGRARSLGASTIEFVGRFTEWNGPAQRFLESLASESTAMEGPYHLFRIEAARDAACADGHPALEGATEGAARPRT